MKHVTIAIRALQELGPRRLGLYGLYRLGLRSGYLRWATRGDRLWAKMDSASFAFSPLLKLPERGELDGLLGERGQAQLLEEAEGQGLLALERDEKSGGYIVRRARSA